MIIIACVFLSFLNQASLDDGLQHTSNHISWEAKLHEYLKLQYKFKELSGNKPRNTTVSVRFLLKSFDLLNDDQEFKIYNWMFISWSDPLLKWDPADFDGIDSTILGARNIWTPDIQMDDDILMHGDIHWAFFVDDCRITFGGSVLCVARVVHTVPCQTKLNNWPYDIQTCRLNYTSKQNVEKGNTRGISTIGAEYGTSWNILICNYTFDKSESKIILTFVVERLALNLVCMYVIPLFVIVILNFSAMVIDIKSSYRVYMLSFCLLSHYMFMREINSVIPLNGYETPTVLIFLRSSLVLSAFSIAATFLLKNLRGKANSPPSCVLEFNKFFLDGSRKVFQWSKLMGDSVRISTEDTKDWIVFTNLLNYLNISVYCLVYPILFLVYMPRSNIE